MSRRNFRSSYYDTLGVRAVEEKKALERLLLQEKIELDLLKKFCLKFNTPSMHRTLVWKLILEVLPVHRDIHDVVMEEHRGRYLALKSALTVTRRVCGVLPDLPSLHLQMILLEKGKLYLKSPTEGSAICPDSCSIAQSLYDMLPDEADSYLIFSKISVKHQVVKEFVPQLQNSMLHYLELEFSNFYTRLVSESVISIIPSERWYLRCFAGTLPSASLERVWDKLLAGSIAVLSFVAVGIITACLMSEPNLHDHMSVLETLLKLPDDYADRAVNKGLELWMKYHSPLSMTS